MKCTYESNSTIKERGTKFAETQGQRSLHQNSPTDLCRGQYVLIAYSGKNWGWQITRGFVPIFCAIRIYQRQVNLKVD